MLEYFNDKNDVIYVNNHAKDMLQGFTKQINAVENESSDLIISFQRIDILLKQAISL